MLYGVYRGPDGSTDMEDVLLESLCLEGCDAHL